MRNAVIGLGLCLAASTARAADLETSKPAGIRESLERQPALSAARDFEAQAGAKPPGLAEWNAKLERAKARRSSGKKLTFIGSGAVVLLGFAVVNSSSNVGLYEVGSAVGVGVAGFGVFRWYGATEEINDLDREGRTKGYLTLGPTRHRGIQAAVTWRF